MCKRRNGKAPGGGRATSPDECPIPQETGVFVRIRKKIPGSSLCPWGSLRLKTLLSRTILRQGAWDSGEFAYFCYMSATRRRE